MEALKIEPVTNESELKQLNLLTQQDISIDHDFLFSAIINDELSGFIHLCPINHNGVIIRFINYKNKQVAKNLITESLKCAWEFGFSMVFTSLKDPVFKIEGFSEPGVCLKDVVNLDGNILIYPLTTNDIDTYCKSLNINLN